MKRTSTKVISVLFALVIMALSCTTAFAAISPTGSPELNVVIIPTGGGTGTYEYETEIEQGPNGGTIVHFTPKPNDGYTFVRWELTGKYTITEGSLTSGSFTIEAFSDIVATPYYVKAGESTPSETEHNSSKTSPQTGIPYAVPVAVVVVLVAGAGVFVVKRKLSK